MAQQSAVRMASRFETKSAEITAGFPFVMGTGDGCDTGGGAFSAGHGGNRQSPGRPARTGRGDADRPVLRGKRPDRGRSRTGEDPAGQYAEQSPLVRVQTRPVHS